jgi:hypothetical protein
MTTGRRRAVNSLIALAAALLTISWAAGAEALKVYMYRDSRGVLHFTDAPTDSRFRPFEVKAQIIIGAGGRRMDHRLFLPYILAASQTYSLDPALVAAVIKVESGFDPMAVSWAGAQGLMQLIPSTAQLMEVKNAFNPRENIYGGCRYLRQMLDRFNGDTRLALAAYNCGPERVAKDGDVPAIRETQAYVTRVLQFYKVYRSSL